MKALVGTFNQEKALVGAFSVIVKTDCENDESFTALDRISASHHLANCIIIITAALHPAQHRLCGAGGEN